MIYNGSGAKRQTISQKLLSVGNISFSLSFLFSDLDITWRDSYYMIVSLFGIGFDAVVNKTISDGGITVDFWIFKVHTSN